MVHVSEAVASRRSVRHFLPRAVDRAIVRRALEKAQRAPSGGNVQPWNVHVLEGAALQRLIDGVGEQIPRGRAAQSSTYAVYPAELEGRYSDSRFEVGESMYAALGIPRADKAGRLARLIENYRAFGAPMLMLVHTPHYMGPPQWADLGIWLQTLLLLLHEEGIATCPQGAWTIYHKDIRRFVPIPADHTLYCGVAIGYADETAPVNNFPVSRVPVDQVVTFLCE